MTDITGKVTIVTGAGRGIGKAIALTFGRAGARVVVASRTKSTVDAVVSQIISEGGSAAGIECDVGDRRQVFQLIDRTVDQLGTVDVLVNNAQSFGTPEAPSATLPSFPLEEWADDQWEHIYRTGLLGTLWGMQAAFPYLKKRGGKIINFCSHAGLSGMAGTAAYNSTKEAIRALTRTGAREWGPYKINVNVISPVLASDGHYIWEKTHAEQVQSILAQIPMGRFGDPLNDGGPLALFLASSASDFVTGMTFKLDGGMLLTP